MTHVSEPVERPTIHFGPDSDLHPPQESPHDCRGLCGVKIFQLPWNAIEQIIILCDVALVINLYRLTRYWQSATRLRKLLVDRTALGLNTSRLDLLTFVTPTLLL